MTIKQFYVGVDREEWKLDTLCDLCEELTATVAQISILVFCNTRRKVEWLTTKMGGRSYAVLQMHDDMPQEMWGVAARKV